MIQIDPGGVMASIITVLLAIISLAAWMGALSQRVKGINSKTDRDKQVTDKLIEANRREAEKSMERLHTENRDDHQKIFAKLEEVNLYLRDCNSKPK